jgi:hypothetical protein
MNKTLKDLRAQRDRLLALRAENKAQLDSVTAEINRLEAEQDIAKRVANLTPDQQSALFQSLSAGGIESGERFGTI